ncbi:MAG TPA: lysophospholipid acyltransferase family protein [Candidatus Obscuribacter sp.]|nr:lysophospholipid acyltransferase family protein [Candidatus Obscuribacter sp.]
MLRKVQDQKDPLSFTILATLARIVLDNYLDIKIKGLENLPEDGPFILVANHSSRFDGPTIGRIINRPANFMVHPNELKGLQGLLLRKVGAFSASARYDFVSHVLTRFQKGEPFVIFPEGTVHYDGYTHSFKKGVARVAFAALKAGLDVPVIPVACGYDLKGRKTARYNIGKPVSVAAYGQTYEQDPGAATNRFLSCLHREVLGLRSELGYELDREQLLLTEAPSAAKGTLLLPVGNQLVDGFSLSA